MTTSGMSYGDRNGLQDQRKPGKYSPVKPSGIPTLKRTNKSDLPNVLVCFKSEKPAVKEIAKKGEDKKDKGLKRSKSRELRGGILYVGCDCERRNGLQDSCPRTECQGAPECLTVPPTCPPSEFAQAKHIAKAFEQLQKARAEFAQKMGGGGNGKDKKGGSPFVKVDYDCFPLDDMIAAGGPCPICEKPISGCDGKPPQDRIVVMDFPADCLC